MNTDKLKELADRVEQVERKLKTQQSVAELEAALSNLTNQPQNPDHQSRLALAFQNFKSAREKFQAAFSPQDFDRLLELSAEAFDPTAADRIADEIAENTMSPSVVRDTVSQFNLKVAEVFEKLRQLSEHMGFFELGYEPSEQEDTEVGFQIPRELFSNNLEGFVKELKEIRLMVMYLSQAQTGDYSPPEVRSISTSDPLIFLEMAQPLAIAFASVVTWSLGVWYTVEKIRNLRAQTAEINSFSEDEIEDFFGKKIKSEIDLQISDKIDEILEEGNAPKKLQGQLRGELKWVLESLMAKIERGMTVELRVSAAEEMDDEDEATEDQEQAEKARQQLLKLQEQLKFPDPKGQPLLELQRKDDP